MEESETQGVYPGYIPSNIPVNQSRSYGDQLDFIKELLNKDNFKGLIDPSLLIYFESFMKTVAIANFTDSEIKLMSRRYDDEITAFLMRLPPGAYTWDIEYQFTALRNIARAELTRGKDGFERKLMATSINQTYMQGDFKNNVPMSGNTGIMSRFKKFFGR